MSISGPRTAASWFVKEARSLESLNEDHQGATPEKNIAGNTATPQEARVDSTVEEIQEQPDGSKQTVRIDAKRNSWQVDNHGVNREALIKAYDVLVKTPEDRKKLEISAPLLVVARDQVVVQLKREKLAAELNQRNLQNHTVRSMKL